MKKSLYETLEISENASAEDIKKAYRRLARKYHPDINKDKNAEEKFKEINAAYEVLSDSSKKAQYDQFGDSMFGGQNFGDFARSQGNVNLNDILNSIFGAQGGFGQGGHNFFSYNGGFGDFGFGAQNLNLDLQSTLNIPLRTAVLGGKETIRQGGEQFDIKIPAGIRNNEVLRAKGKGKMMGAQRGDLLLKIQIQPDEEYQIHGDDLLKTCDIPLKTALFGGSIDISTLHKNMKLKIPSNTKNGQKFRLKELGIKNPKTVEIGDLYLKINILMPQLQSLSLELQDMLKKEL